VVCHGLGLGLAVRRRWSQEANPPSAVALLGMTGLAAFPLALALGFLVYWVVGDRGQTLELLSGLVALAGVPTLTAGLLVQQRLVGPAGERHGLLAVTGTGVALLGMLVMLAALACAWPQPGALILVGLLNFAVLTGVALGVRLPAAHAVALASLTVSYV